MGREWTVLYIGLNILSLETKWGGGGDSVVHRSNMLSLEIKWRGGAVFIFRFTVHL